jgi:phosphate-selective porin OprO/OprP
LYVEDESTLKLPTQTLSAALAGLLVTAACSMTGGLRHPLDAEDSADPIAGAPSSQTGSDTTGAPQEGPEEQRVESEILEKRRGGLNDGIAPRRRFLSGTHLYWDQGPRLDAFDGDLTVVLGGRLQIDAATFSEDPEISSVFGAPDPGVDVRRAFFELGALYLDRYEFRFMMDFSGTGELSELTSPVSDVDFRDIFVGMLDVPFVGAVRVGYFKEPFGLEEIESSNDITFMERSLTDAMVERRNLGVMMHRLHAERLGTTSLGFYRDATNELDIGDGYGLTGRVTSLPVYDDEGRRLLHLGAAATYRTPSNDTLRFLSKPESNQAAVLADTGFFAATRDFRLGLEAAHADGPLTIQSEFVLSTSNGDVGFGDPVFPAFYLMGSYIVTGESRLYRKNVGAFGRVHPDTALGAWELIARYSYLDLDSAGIQGGVLHDVTAGVNWYANSYSRVMFNYVAAHPEGFGVEHIFQLRLQVDI